MRTPMKLTQDPQTKAEMYYEQVRDLFEKYALTRLRYEYTRSGNEPAGNGHGQLEVEARAVVRAWIQGTERVPKLNPEQTAVFDTEADGVRIAEGIKTATQHRDTCRNAAEWSPEAARSLNWLRQMRHAIAGELNVATRETALLHTLPLDDTEGARAFWSNSLVQGVVVLAATSAVLPFLGMWYIGGFVGFGLLLQDNPIGVHMTLSDFATAGTIGAVTGLGMVGTYGLMRWLKRIEWSGHRYEKILSRFPYRMEAAPVLAGYTVHAVPSLMDDDRSLAFKLVCVLIGIGAVVLTIAGRRLASRTLRWDRRWGTAISIIALMMAGASYAGAWRQDRQNNTEYSYTFTTRAAIYDTCEYIRLQPIPRITVLRARRARHTIILKAEDITETIRMDSNTVTCSTAR